MNRPIVMGIINATPDSFYDGGRYRDLVARANTLITEGADWIDVGGESTRPGAELVSTEEELNRVLPLIEQISEFATVSIDTTKPEVAEAAHRAGATILNDVQGLQNPKMMEVSALFKKTIIMHSRGRPANMQQLTQYDSIVEEVTSWLLQQAQQCLSQEIWLDPGIGFAKTAEQSLTLVRHLDQFVALDYPILLGASRKSFIGRLLGNRSTDQRLAGSLAAVAAGWNAGVKAFRVHDVQETRDVLDFLQATSREE